MSGGASHDSHDNDGADSPEQWTADFWDERYSTRDHLWSGQPNPVLVEEVADLSPGTALDVACGEGADAIWLAERGWSVTGIDVSAVAVRRAAEHATQRGVGVDFAVRDLLTERLEPRAFDLVTVAFLHLPPAERARVYANIAASVIEGGTLLVFAHHPHDLDTTMRRPRHRDLFFTHDEIIEDLGEGWQIVRAEARSRPATDHDGNAVTLHDTVVRARRISR